MISSSSMTRMDPLRVAAEAGESVGATRGMSSLPVQRLRAGRGAGGRERECQRKPGPLADCTVARDAAAVLLNDSVGDRQSEPCAFSDFLRREERVVNAREL